MLQLNNIIKTPISTFFKFIFEVFVLITEKSKLLLTLIQGTLSISRVKVDKKKKTITNI